MNIVLGIICLVVSTYIGYYFSKKYIEKKKFYNDFYFFNKSLYNQISFSQKSLYNVINDKNNDSYFINSLRRKIIDKDYNYNLSSSFTKDDKDLFIEYSSNLGSSDYSTQKKFLTDIEAIILNKKNESEINEKKYKNTYVKLGFTIGLIILIILL